MKKKKISILILVLLALTFIFFIVNKIYHGFVQNIEAFKEDLPSTYTLPIDVSSIISKDHLSQLKVKEIRNSKVRNPISVILYKEKFQIIIYKINIKTNSSFIENIIHGSFNSSDRTTGYTYSIFENESFFKFEYKSGPVDSTEKIYFTFFGDSLNVSYYNATTLGYKLRCKNFSIRYSEKDPVDIYMVGKNLSFGKTINIPMNLLFLKKEKSVYLLILTPEEERDYVPNDILYDLVK